MRITVLYKKIKRETLIKTSVLLTAAVLTASGCGSTHEIPYMTDADSISSSQLKDGAKIYEARIMPKDILTISVNTTVPEAAAPFNLGSNVGSGVITQGTSVQGAELQTYVVDNHGDIEYPVIGKLHVNGLTRVELQDLIRDKIHPAFITEVPIINVRFKNYKVSVLGEVARPGSYTVQNEQCTIFDALALAGDLTIYGKRTNLLLIRESATGQKSIRRINLQNSSIVTDPEIYYLQQNDVLIVEPNKTKAKMSRVGSAETFTIAIVSTLVSIATLLVTVLR